MDRATKYERLKMEYKIKDYQLKKKISEADTLSIENFIDWRVVGPALPEIDTRKVENIDIEVRGNNELLRARKLLQVFHQRNADGATYEVLIKAMLSKELDEDATKVFKLLAPSGPLPHPPFKQDAPQPLGPPGTTVVKPRNQRGPGGGPLGPRGTTLADSPGVAILVTCDYKGISALSTLDGTNNDAKEIKKTFDFFNYIVFQLQNEQACKKDIEALLKEVSEDLSKYQGETENKVIMFAFSGHGTNEDEAEQIFAYDGQTLDIKEEIVLPLTRHKAVAYIPKLFFIDACRGEMSLVSKVAGAADTTKSASDQQYFEKGVQHVEGNYRIDYATIPEHVSYANSAGSIWLPVLARALREENDSFQNIADNVKKQVHQQLGNKKQQCESVNRLNTGALYLQK